MVKKPPAVAGDIRRCQFDTSVRKAPGRRAQQPAPGVLPGEPHGQRSLAGCRPYGHTESDTTEATAHTHSKRTEIKESPSGLVSQLRAYSLIQERNFILSWGRVSKLR